MSAEQTEFTYKYFCAEMGRLREAWGTKDFWRRSDEDRQAMIKGLLHVYFNLEGTDKELKHAEAGLDAILFEYSKRAALVITHPEVLNNEPNSTRPGPSQGPAKLD